MRRFIPFGLVSLVSCLFPGFAAAQFNDAIFLSQSVPETLLPGQTATVVVRMVNTGSATWVPGAYFLGSQSPENNWTWGSARVELDVPVGPGQQRNFLFTIVAPMEPGLYAFEWRMVEEYVEWFGDYSTQLGIRVVAPSNRSRFLSFSVPPSFLPGETKQVSITMENNGSTTWTPGSHFLGSQNPENNYTWDRNRVSVGSPVAPGQQKTFTFDVTAPFTPNVYGFQWQMLEEGREWFGDKTPNLPTSVVAPVNRARFLSQSIPLAMLTGETATASITFRNDGEKPWTPAEGYFLGSQSPENNRTWGLNRVALEGSVSPGQQKTFTFTITAPPTEGAPDFCWQMLQEGVEWFGDPSTCGSIAVLAPRNDATFVSQTVPSLILPGASAEVTLTMGNTGSSTWEPGAEFFLGSQSPENNWTWGLARVVLDRAVPPGQDITFRFSITAPEISGSYEFQWRMVQETVAWFGEASPNRTVTVGRSNGARFIAQSVPPILLPGDTASVSVTMENTGATEWTSHESYFLGSVNPENNYTWGLNRVELDEPVPPGGTHTFHFTITAPVTIGGYNFQWRMLEENREWFGEPTQNTVIGTGSTDDDAEFVSHSIPTNMVSGYSESVRVTVRNTGVSTWTRDGDSPEDGSRGFKLMVIDGNLLPVGQRFSLPPELSVSPGESFTFEFTVVPPFFEWATTKLQMVHEGVGLFGEALFASVDVQQSDLPPSSIFVSPSSGPPGTLVAVDLAEGNAFHPFSRVAFHFGEPDANDYSRVPVETTWLGDSRLTFEVPPDADCGTHFASVFAPAAPEVRVSKPVRFVVTGPCDEARRSSWDLLSYNVHLLPWPGSSHNDYRAGLIATHPDMRNHDVVVLVESQSDNHRQMITWGLRFEYPYQSRILGSDALIGLPQDGGVIILSKWPIEAQNQLLYGSPCEPNPDCLGRKGVNYVRINKAGKPYHVFGTHLESGHTLEDRYRRWTQLLKMSSFIDSRGISAEDAVLMAGDFNVDKNEADGEYESMLSILSASQPQNGGIRSWTNAKGEWLDYVLYSNAHLPPASSTTWVLTPRDAGGGDLSDHYAVLGTFQFSGSAAQVALAGCSSAPSGTPIAGGPIGDVGSPWPTFSWEAAEGASSYTVDVFRESDGAHLLHRTRLAGTSFVPDSPLPAGEELQWQVRGENLCGTGPASSPTRFAVTRKDDSPPTTAPTPNWPGDLIGNPRPSFSWGPVEGAASYELVVLRRDDESLVVQQEVSGTSFQPEAALPVDVELVWTVRGVNPAGAGPYSASAAFEIRVPAVNQPPAVTLSHSASCSTGCTVTFTASAEDPELDPLSFSWTGCGSGNEDHVTCSAAQSGEIEVSVVVNDGKGGEATSSATVSIYASGWEPGSWGSCTGAGEWTCTSAGADGCSRPGTETRSVTESTWSLDPGASPPESTRSCSETTQGYAAAYTTGAWSGCTASCGGGWQTRTVSPSAWKATSPATPAPPASQACNTQACGLTCYDYPTTYPSLPLCLAAGWPVCERRFRDDGLGGTLVCFKGFY
jgi:endonuclease/exonuclease/phosphatase family metal-dependent hydrolase